MDMELKQYISSARGIASQLALQINVSPAFLSQMASGIRSVSAKNAVAIEKATKGAVSRKDLRPSDWNLHWPELAKGKRK